jgi:hypothetical protein
MRFLHLISGILASAALVGCVLAADRGQELEATGTVYAADGSPLANARIEAYSVWFAVADGHEVERRYDDDARGAKGITTDKAGRFEIQAAELALSYQWEEDVWECHDVCTLWETDCYLVTEDVCVDVCEPVTYEECWEECTPVCWDEVVCDDEGYCWEETVCQDECTTYCEPVTVEECYAECHEETFEQCDDICLETVEQCDWVTYTHTEYPDYAEIVSAHAEIRIRDGEGVEHVVTGETLESGQAQRCEERRCEPVNVWRQDDRFVVPFGR